MEVVQKLGKLEKAVQIQGISKAKRDFPYFLKTYVKTLDEHDSIFPIKPFPNKEYLMELAFYLQTERKLIIEKSRQMMCSWAIASFAVWEAMFQPGKRIAIQSKKESDSDEMIKRCKLIYQYLPAELKQLYPIKEPSKFLKLVFLHGSQPESEIRGVQQGSDQLRGLTLSTLISDEFAFQSFPDDTYTASAPTVEGGGKLFLISTPNGRNLFWRLAYDEEV